MEPKIEIVDHPKEKCEKGEHCEGCVFEFEHAAKYDIPNPSTHCCVCKEKLNKTGTSI